MTNAQPELEIIFVSRFMKVATAVFNGNGFPESAQREVAVCANRFGLFLYNSTLMEHAIQMDLSEFKSNLKAHANDLELSCKSYPNIRMVAYVDGLHYLITLHSVLYSLKSLLDVFSRLVCKLVNPLTEPTAFGKKKVDGKELSGAKLASWVEGSSPDSYTGKIQLRDLILSNSREWISNAVNYRDTLAHFREIRNMELMQAPINATLMPFILENIQLPKLPDGKLLDDYCLELVAKLGKFLDDVIPLLPNIKLEMIEPWQSSQCYLKA